MMCFIVKGCKIIVILLIILSAFIWFHAGIELEKSDRINKKTEKFITLDMWGKITTMIALFLVSSLPEPKYNDNKQDDNE